MILLTAEENPYRSRKSAPPEMDWGIRARCFDEGAKAQLKKVVKDMVMNGVGNAINHYPNKDVYDYWQALLEEVKE